MIDKVTLKNFWGDTATSWDRCRPLLRTANNASFININTVDIGNDWFIAIRNSEVDGIGYNILVKIGNHDWQRERKRISTDLLYWSQLLKSIGTISI